MYRFEFPAEGGTVKLRNVTRVTGPRTLVSEEFMAVNGSPEILFVRVDAKRQ